MKGVFVSLSEGEVASYAVTLDAQGHELKRDRLRRGGGQMRIAPPVDPECSGPPADAWRASRCCPPDLCCRSLRPTPACARANGTPWKYFSTRISCDPS